MKNEIKTILFISIGVFFLSIQSRAQTQPDSTLMARYLLDFSVPDMPAFKALGTDPSDILRPSDIKKFAVMVSPFYTNGKAVIPKNFALEVAPWKLASKKWTLEDYKNSPGKRFLYNSSFSLGAINDTTAFPSKLSIGYRVSFLSKRADIYRTAEIRNKIYHDPSSQQNVQAAHDQLINDWLTLIVHQSAIYYQTHQSDFKDFLSTLDDYLKVHPNTQIKNDYIILINLLSNDDPNTQLTNDKRKDIIGTYAKRLDDFIEKYKEDNWNASRTDIAIAWVGQSKDSLISNAQYSSFLVWATQAIRTNKNGQLLIGGALSLPRNISEDSSRLNLSINLRYYLGTQDFRGFFESQYKYQKNQAYDKSLLFNLGGELRVGNSFWVVASAGINNYLKTTNPLSKLVSSIDLRYGFNK